MSEIESIIERDSAFVRQALRQTPREYLDKCLAMRLGETAVGSLYRMKHATALYNTLYNADWSAFEHPSIAPGCRAFIAPIPGIVRLLSLDSLDPNSFVTLEDPKGTGFVAPVIDMNSVDLGTPVDYTVIIIGQDDSSTGTMQKWMVFTFHPGDPVAPSTIKGESGKVVTVAEARTLGFEHAKVR